MASERPGFLGTAHENLLVGFIIDAANKGHVDWPREGDRERPPAVGIREAIRAYHLYVYDEGKYSIALLSTTLGCSEKALRRAMARVGPAIDLFYKLIAEHGLIVKRMTEAQLRALEN
jgi:hypothetical protein